MTNLETSTCYAWTRWTSVTGVVHRYQSLPSGEADTVVTAGKPHYPAGMCHVCGE